MLRHPIPRVRLYGERSQIVLPARSTGEWRRTGYSRNFLAERRVGVALVIIVSVLVLMGAAIHAG